MGRSSTERHGAARVTRVSERCGEFAEWWERVTQVSVWTDKIQSWMTGTCEADVVNSRVTRMCYGGVSWSVVEQRGWLARVTWVYLWIAVGTSLVIARVFAERCEQLASDLSTRWASTAMILFIASEKTVHASARDLRGTAGMIPGTRTQWLSWKAVFSTR